VLHSRGYRRHPTDRLCGRSRKEGSGFLCALRPQGRFRRHVVQIRNRGTCILKSNGTVSAKMQPDDLRAQLPFWSRSQADLVVARVSLVSKNANPNSCEGDSSRDRRKDACWQWKLRRTMKTLEGFSINQGGRVGTRSVW
jgi:hypothetical protein